MSEYDEIEMEDLDPKPDKPTTSTKPNDDDKPTASTKPNDDDKPNIAYSTDQIDSVHESDEEDYDYHEKSLLTIIFSWIVTGGALALAIVNLILLLVVWLRSKTIISKREEIDKKYFKKKD